MDATEVTIVNGADSAADAAAAPVPARAPAPAPAAAPARPTTARGPDSLSAAFGHPLSLATRTVHADDYINSHRAVAPPLHVSTTFRYSDDPDELVVWENRDANAPYDSHIYARDSAPNTTRLEALLGSVLGGPALTYSSGLAAFFALVVFLRPARIAIGPAGYHGCRGVVELLSRLYGLEVLPLPDPAEDAAAADDGGTAARLRPGDVVHVETPVNPTGEAYDVAALAALARGRGCVLTVDATLAPPPLQDPLALGADAVVHSGTKYLGGHSDMLCGVVAVAPARAEAWVAGLRAQRLLLGSVMGSLEGWLGVRSVRTLELRVERQSAAAGRLVAWLDGAARNGGGDAAGRVVDKVFHASLQPEAAREDSWLRRQMPRGYGPVFAVWMRSEDAARKLPSRLRLFHHATSLGGVESLIEWRAMTDKTVDRRLLRLSIGVEAWEDLKADLEAGFQALVDEGLGIKTAGDIAGEAIGQSSSSSAVKVGGDSKTAAVGSAAPHEQALPERSNGSHDPAAEVAGQAE